MREEPRNHGVRPTRASYHLFVWRVSPGPGGGPQMSRCDCAASDRVDRPYHARRMPSDASEFGPISRYVNCIEECEIITNLISRYVDCYTFHSDDYESIWNLPTGRARTQAGVRRSSCCTPGRCGRSPTSSSWAWASRWRTTRIGERGKCSCWGSALYHIF